MKAHAGAWYGHFRPWSPFSSSHMGLHSKQERCIFAASRPQRPMSMNAAAVCRDARCLANALAGGAATSILRPLALLSHEACSLQVRLPSSSFQVHVAQPLGGACLDLVGVCLAPFQPHAAQPCPVKGSVASSTRLRNSLVARIALPCCT